MKVILITGIMILGLCKAYAQESKKEDKKAPDLNIEIPREPQIVTDSIAFQPQEEFYDNMSVAIPDSDKMEEMPLMPIDTTTHFTIREKRYRSMMGPKFPAYQNNKH